ncbi:AAA family ATPase [Bacillus firmus]|uniref:AAA family ATPase n=1 Tax=Cytobacillus firmus TaxID=1399 RepID=UPI0015807681|nr:AAA family ATPase [Cytobacillus firmus]NUH86152.1 AAA family ATPase [Cytobacillus firmus]
MEEDKGLIPVLPLEAIASESSNFDWKDFYIRALIALKDPFIDHKISVEEDEFSKKLVVKNSNSVKTLRRSFENALKYRKPSVIMIEEAQHMMKMSSAKFKDQMDRLKSICSLTNTPMILFGTYELLEFRNLSGQLIRRGMDIEFPRYKPNDSEMREFKGVLGTFQKKLPLEKEPNLVGNLEYFYERSIGCIGILKQWLLKTLKYHLRKNPDLKTLTIDDFKEFELSINQCVTLATEAKFGEDKLKKDNERNELRRLLGFSSEKSKKAESVQTTQKVSENKGKPFQRNPKRDEVGKGSGDIKKAE